MICNPNSRILQIEPISFRSGRVFFFFYWKKPLPLLIKWSILLPRLCCQIQLRLGVIKQFLHFQLRQFGATLSPLPEVASRIAGKLQANLKFAFWTRYFNAILEEYLCLKKKIIHRHHWDAVVENCTPGGSDRLNWERVSQHHQLPSLLKHFF